MYWPKSLIGLPLLVQTPAAWVALTEADLRDWAGMWIGGAATTNRGGVMLTAKLAPRLDQQGLDGEVAKHLVIARHSGKEWFLGALTDTSARDMMVNLDFLGKGSWKMRLWKDVPDSERKAENLTVEERVVTAAGLLSVHLAPAGGYVARFQQESTNKQPSYPVAPRRRTKQIPKTEECHVSREC